MRSDITSIILLPFCVAVSLLAATVQAEDKKPELTDIIVTTSDVNLLLFATVKNPFTSEMITAVQNGIAITFEFHIELEKVKNNWFDSSLVDRTITHTLKYNSLKQEYSIEQSEKKGKAKRTRSLEDAKQTMAEINGIPVITLQSLIPDKPYKLNIKATLQETTLPLGMQNILPFTSLWNFETDWRTIEFRY